MRAHYSGLVLFALGTLSSVQADTYKLYEQPVKRSFLGDLLGKLNGGGDGSAGDNGGGGQTVTETVRQTITVGGAGLGGLFNNSAQTVTATVTVTQLPDAAAV
ncbi:hypothetical protein O1611_g10439 [Lasiodiplodia mahajangana]|uniref:Uncharacterized protein n=1 Tax=Lasiodiplodia mahajangana TaxID=1108764 RepID=A0ACC2IY30_9PEZI|nr:hypothetical protein O1611_g10439 [Lasiodiplodia mahajangana]